MFHLQIMENNRPDKHFNSTQWILVVLLIKSKICSIFVYLCRVQGLQEGLLYCRTFTPGQITIGGPLYVWVNRNYFRNAYYFRRPARTGLVLSRGPWTFAVWSLSAVYVWLEYLSWILRCSGEIQLDIFSDAEPATKVAWSLLYYPKPSWEGLLTLINWPFGYCYCCFMVPVA